MSTATRGSRAIWRHSVWDAVLVMLALVHAAIVLAWPVVPIIALGVWWNSNTISHNFIHRPFFRHRTLNVLFSLYLSMLIGIPQTLWRDRHLAHHAGGAWRLRIGRQLVAESVVVLGLWVLLLALAPVFFLTVYLPGLLIGLAICSLHGHYEHAGGDTISHYGRLYNLLFFNDGYHVEHHANPGTHWRTLPRQPAAAAQTSRWPAVLRWLDRLSLEALERRVLQSKGLQRLVLQTHERAFRRLMPELRAVCRVGIVGGGLFPRTALVLERLLPEARVVIIDLSNENLRTARRFLNGNVEFVHDAYDPVRHNEFDLVVIPLSFRGDRQSIYEHPPAPTMLVHDWIWRPRGVSAVVSWLLLKRLNLIRQGPLRDVPHCRQAHPFFHGILADLLATRADIGDETGRIA